MTAPPAPPFSIEQLKVRALLALYEMADQATAQPYPRTRTLRFVLAFLYSRSNGDRSAFDEFWRLATRPKSDNDLDATAAYVRSSYMRTQMIGLCEAVGERPRLIEDYFYAEKSQRAMLARRKTPG